MCDVALDPYTNHGHDGLLKNGYVDNNNDASKLLDISYLVSYSFGKRSASLSNDMYPKYATA